MELISVYVYNSAPVQTENILNSSFHEMKRNEWYNDTRSNQKFVMLNKRFKVENKWYRAMIRFEKKGVVNNVERYSLSQPSPFLVTECHRALSLDDSFYVMGHNERWEDSKVYHGPKLKDIAGMIAEGVPAELIDLVHSDLKQYIKHI